MVLCILSLPCLVGHEYFSVFIMSTGIRLLPPFFSLLNWIRKFNLDLETDVRNKNCGLLSKCTHTRMYVCTLYFLFFLSFFHLTLTLLFLIPLLPWYFDMYHTYTCTQISTFHLLCFIGSSNLFSSLWGELLWTCVRMNRGTSSATLSSQKYSDCSLMVL